MPETVPADAAPPRRLTPWGLVLAALTAVMWGRFLIFPSVVAGNNLDHSWMQAMGHFYRSGARAGTDYVFTYGPLGYFATEAYDGALYWQRYAWELAVKLAAAAAIMAALARLPGRGLTLLGAALVIVFVPYHFDTIYLVTLLAAGAVLIDGASRRPITLLVVPLLALLAMTKFTYFLLALWAVVLAELAARLRGYRGVLSPAPLYLVSAAAVWLYCGQNPLHLWAYCRNSWEVSQGYGEAMSASGETFDLGLAAVTMGLAVLLLALAAWRNRRSAAHVLTVLWLGPALFLGWKNGLIRHDTHAFLFFGMAMFVALLLPRLLGPDTPGLTGMAVGCLLACSVGGTLLTNDRARTTFFKWNLVDQTKANLRAALAPRARRDELEAGRARQEEEWRLDRVRAEAGDATLDELSSAQGVVLLNGFNWHPRPVFQSYTAYTPYLLRLNAEFFRSGAAPEYVLCRFEPVDARLPAMEDSLALLEILRRYHPVVAEKEFVLFRRVPPGEESAPAEPEAVCRRTIHFDEDVSLDDVPGEYQLLSLRIAPSGSGRVWGALFKRDRLFLDLRTASGATLHRRLVPAMAGEGFLINPLVASTADYVRLYGTTGGDRVVSFRVTPASDDYRGDIEMAVSALPRLPCRTLDATAIDALAPR